MDKLSGPFYCRRELCFCNSSSQLLTVGYASHAPSAVDQLSLRGSLRISMMPCGPLMVRGFDLVNTESIAICSITPNFSDANLRQSTRQPQSLDERERTYFVRESAVLVLHLDRLTSSLYPPSNGARWTRASGSVLYLRSLTVRPVRLQRPMPRTLHGSRKRQFPVADFRHRAPPQARLGWRAQRVD